MPIPKEKRRSPDDGTKNLKAETAYARQLFLYGDGDGKRIVTVKRICEISGITEQTVCRHMPKWEKEYEEIIRGTSKQSLALGLSERDIELHKATLDTLADQLYQVQWELKQFDSIVAALENICNNFALNSDNGNEALRLLENYLSSRLTKENLRKMFMAMQKQHADITGILSVMDIHASAAKELEKGRVRMRLKKEGGEQLRDVTPDDGKLAVFDR